MKKEISLNKNIEILIRIPNKLIENSKFLDVKKKKGRKKNILYLFQIKKALKITG
jgi:hypothetical protein